MMTPRLLLILLFNLLHGVAASAAQSPVPLPKEIIDLGAVVTEDLPVRTSGKAFGNAGKTKFAFDARRNADGSIAGQTSFLTLFSHGGPHVDAPIHTGIPGGLETIPVERFIGRLKVVDTRKYGLGYTIPVDEFRNLGLTPEDIVFIYTGYVPPQTDDGRPQTSTLTKEAAEYLAGIPLRAFGTDAWGVESMRMPGSTGEAFSVHKILLGTRMPVFEQLFNLERLLGKQNMLLVAPPLNIEGGDAMMVRPVVLVY